VILHLEGDLSFAVATELTDRLREIADRGPRILLLRLKRARHLDATVAEALRELAVVVRERNVELVLFGLGDELAEQLSPPSWERRSGPEVCYGRGAGSSRASSTPSITPGVVSRRSTIRKSSAPRIRASGPIRSDRGEKTWRGS
jgi:SulP family sulfate permease